MKKSKKILISLSFLFILIGTIGATLTFRFSIAPQVKDYKKTIQLSKNIDTLKIDSKAYDYEIKPSNSDDLIIEKNGYIEKINPLKLIKKQTNNTLQLDLNQQKNYHNPVIHLDGLENITIYVPKSIKTVEVNAYKQSVQVKNLNLNRFAGKTSTGTIFLENIEAKNLSLSQEDNHVSAKNFLTDTFTFSENLIANKTTTDNFSATTKNDDINFTKFTTKKAYIQTDTGDINLILASGNLDVKSKTGDLNLHNHDLKDNMQFATKTGEIYFTATNKPENLTISSQIKDTNDIKIFGKRKNTVIFGNGKKKLNLQTDAGTIKVKHDKRSIEAFEDDEVNLDDEEDDDE